MVTIRDGKALGSGTSLVVLMGLISRSWRQTKHPLDYRPIADKMATHHLMCHPACRMLDIWATQTGVHYEFKFLHYPRDSNPFLYRSEAFHKTRRQLRDVKRQRKAKGPAFQDQIGGSRGTPVQLSSAFF